MVDTNNSITSQQEAIIILLITIMHMIKMMRLKIFVQAGDRYRSRNIIPPNRGFIVHDQCMPHDQPLIITIIIAQYSISFSGVGSSCVLRGPPIQVVGVALNTEFCDHIIFL